MDDKPPPSRGDVLRARILECQRLFDEGPQDQWALDRLVIEMVECEQELVLLGERNPMGGR